MINLCKDADGDRLEEEDAEDIKRRHENLEAFKVIFNGDWRNWQVEGLRHYCFLGCQCGCRTELQLKTKAVTLYCSVVMGSRPRVPSLSRWLRCSMTAQWFLFAFAVHGLYLHATKRLYNMNPQKQANPMRQNMRELIADLGHDVGNAAGDAFLLPDLPETKIMRIRSKKAVEWLLGISTPSSLAIAVHVTDPVDSFAHWLFKQQSDTFLQFKSSYKFKLSGTIVCKFRQN